MDRGTRAVRGWGVFAGRDGRGNMCRQWTQWGGGHASGLRRIIRVAAGAVSSRRRGLRLGEAANCQSARPWRGAAAPARRGRAKASEAARPAAARRRALDAYENARGVGGLVVVCVCVWGGACPGVPASHRQACGLPEGSGRVPPTSSRGGRDWAAPQASSFGAPRRGGGGPIWAAGAAEGLGSGGVAGERGGGGGRGAWGPDTRVSCRSAVCKTADRQIGCLQDDRSCRSVYSRFQVYSVFTPGFLQIGCRAFLC